MCFAWGRGRSIEIEKHKDIRLAGRIINEDWPISAEAKESIVDKLLFIVEHGDPELQIAASRTLMVGDALNQKRRALAEKKLALEHKRKLELIELAHKLGIVGDDGGANRVIDSESSRISNE